MIFAAARAGRGTGKRERKEREREREKGGTGTGMNEREEEEPAKLGKKRGRPIINWPRISFAPFFLSVLSLSLFLSSHRQPLLLVRAAGGISGFLDGRRGTGEREAKRRRQRRRGFAEGRGGGGAVGS